MRTSNEQPLTSHPLPFSIPPPQLPPLQPLTLFEIVRDTNLPPLQPLSQIFRDTSLQPQMPFTRDFRDRETSQSRNPANYNNIHHSPAELSQTDSGNGGMKNQNWTLPC
jgi:hypothetical protein